MLADMYRYLLVMLFSNCSWFSLEKLVYLMNMIVHSGIKLSNIAFIYNNIHGYSPLGRGNCGTSTWNALRDETHQLGDIKRHCFTVVRNVFFGTTPLFANLDGDLFGAHAVDNQVKTLSNRKAYNEENTVDFIADAVFRVVLAIRFRRSGESAKKGVSGLMIVMMDVRAGQALLEFMVTADRGYGRDALSS